MKNWFLEVVQDFVHNCDDNGWPMTKEDLVEAFTQFIATYVRK